MMLLSSVSYAESLQITWLDSSDNEDGFAVEKRLEDNKNFDLITYVAENTDTFIDSDVIENETYCYRIVAYNQAGQNPSDESCIKVNETSIIEKVPEDNTSDSNIDAAPVKVEYSYKNVSIDYQYIDQPKVIEVEDKEFYAFKTQQSFNADYSTNKVVNTVFTSDGNDPVYSDQDYFSFQKNGNELSNGFTIIPLNERSNISFDIIGNDQPQTATLYMQTGAWTWTYKIPSIFITVGDTTKEIQIPVINVWKYIAIEFTFQGNTPVTITTDLEDDVYNLMMFAGVVFNEPSSEIEEPEVPIQYASLVSVDNNAKTNIDISNSKFMTSRLTEGNADFSDASIESLSYEGYSWPTSYTYNFINGDDIYSGYRAFKWEEKNAVTINLKSGDSQINTVSLYVATSSWDDKDASFELLINGKSEVIQLNKANTWLFYKIDVEFEGDLTLNLKPIGNLSSYSSIKFAGLTLN